MLIAARHLLDRLREPRSRADQLAALRRRLVAEKRHGSDREVELASEMRALRQQLSTALGRLHSCAECAQGCALPEGRWDGGHCCSGNTEDLFTTEELAALRQGGTRPGALRGPKSDHAGCAFRGPRGCSLAPVDRPNRCVLYLCTQAAREVFARDELDAFEALATRLTETFEHFVRVRRERMDEEWFRSAFPIRAGEHLG